MDDQAWRMMEIRGNEGTDERGRERTRRTGFSVSFFPVDSCFYSPARARIAAAKCPNKYNARHGRVETLIRANKYSHRSGT